MQRPFARQIWSLLQIAAHDVQNELAMLRAEVGALAGQLKDAENRAGLAVRQPCALKL